MRKYRSSLSTYIVFNKYLVNNENKVDQHWQKYSEMVINNFRIIMVNNFRITILKFKLISL